MSRQKERVLIVHNYYQLPGGEDTVVANEKKMLEDNGHTVILYTRNNSELTKLGILRKMLLPFAAVFNLETYRDIRKIIRDQKIDIVHVHNTLSLISPAVYYAACSVKVPIVQTVHNFRLLCPGAIFYRDGHVCEDCVTKGLMCAMKHKCYRKNRLQTLVCVVSTGIHRMTGIFRKIYYISLTDFNKEKLLNLKQIQKDKVFVKPNFIQKTEEFVPNHNRANQFVFAGRLEKIKGIDFLLEAWKQMGGKAPKLIICGVGPMEEWCREYINKNRLNAEMKGYIPNAEVQKIISESKALIFPTQLYEGFPMSIVEAFSTGTPVICPDFGNAGSIVSDHVTGYKYVKDSLESLISAVENVDGRISESTYNEFLEKYTEDHNYRQLTDIYAEARRSK